MIGVTAKRTAGCDTERRGSGAGGRHRGDEAGGRAGRREGRGGRLGPGADAGHRRCRRALLGPPGRRRLGRGQRRRGRLRRRLRGTDDRRRRVGLPPPPPRLAGLPPPGAAGRGHRPAHVRRQRRQGPGPGGGVVRGGRRRGRLHRRARVHRRRRRHRPRRPPARRGGGQRRPHRPRGGRARRRPLPVRRAGLPGGGGVGARPSPPPPAAPRRRRGPTWSSAPAAWSDGRSPRWPTSSTCAWRSWPGAWPSASASRSSPRPGPRSPPGPGSTSPGAPSSSPPASGPTPIWWARARWRGGAWVAVWRGRTVSDARPGWLVPAALAVARRPRLWPVAVRQTLRLARPGWWRRWPPVPRPRPLVPALSPPDRLRRPRPAAVGPRRRGLPGMVPPFRSPALAFLADGRSTSDDEPPADEPDGGPDR